MMDNAEKQKNYRDRMENNGMKLVQVKVPVDDIDRLKRYAQRLRNSRK